MRGANSLAKRRMQQKAGLEQLASAVAAVTAAARLPFQAGRAPAGAHSRAAVPTAAAASLTQ